MHLRTCFLDDVVTSFCNKLSEGQAANLVILGAGYDTRCYRNSLFGQKKRGTTIKLFEVDAPGTQAEKKKALIKAGIIGLDEVTFVSVDFQTQSWMQSLKAVGFDVSLPSCFIWEGVIYYLPRETVQQTLSIIGTQCPSTSVIAFDYFGSWALASFMTRLSAKAGEPWVFAIHSDDELEELLGENGLRLSDHVKHKEAAERYLPVHCSGQSFGFLEDFGGLVVAMKP